MIPLQTVPVSPLLRMPSDVRQLFWEKLDGHAFAKLGMVCKVLYRDSWSDEVWKVIFLRENKGFCPAHVTCWKSLYARKELIKRNFKCQNIEPSILGVELPMMASISYDHLYGGEPYKKEIYLGLTCFDRELKRVKQLHVPGYRTDKFEALRSYGITDKIFKTLLGDFVTYWNGDELLHTKNVKDYHIYERKLKTDRWGKSRFGWYVIYAKKDLLESEGCFIESRKSFFHFQFKTPHEPLVFFEECLWLFSLDEKSIVAYHIATQKLRYKKILPARFQLPDDVKGICHFLNTPYGMFTDDRDKVWVFHFQTGEFHRLRKCRSLNFPSDHFVWGKVKCQKKQDTVFRWDLNTRQIDLHYSISYPVTSFFVNGNRILINSVKTTSLFNSDTGENLYNFHYAHPLKSIRLYSGILYIESMGRTEFWDIARGEKLGNLPTSQLAQIFDGHIVGYCEGRESHYSFYYSLVKPLPKKKLSNFLSFHKTVYHAAERHVINKLGNQ